MNTALSRLQLVSVAGPSATAYQFPGTLCENIGHISSPDRGSVLTRGF